MIIRVVRLCFSLVFPNVPAINSIFVASYECGTFFRFAHSLASAKLANPCSWGAVVIVTFLNCSSQSPTALL